VKVDFKKALTFPFSDSNWVVKILIGIGLSMVPIANFIAIGYVMRVLKGSSEGKEPSLPEWGDWENLFKEGAFGFIIILIYLVAAIFLGMLFQTTCILSPLIPVIILVLIPWCYLSLIKYLSANDFNAAFDFKGIFQLIKTDLADYAVSSLVVAIVFSVCIALCCIPVFYAMLIGAVIFGSLYHLKAQPGAAQ
jgi:hypothetical protein